MARRISRGVRVGRGAGRGGRGSCGGVRKFDGRGPRRKLSKRLKTRG